MKKLLPALLILFAALTLSAQFAKPDNLESGYFSMKPAFRTSPDIIALWDAKTKFPLSLFIRASTGKPAFTETGTTPASVNVFLFKHKDDVVLIDAGYGAFRNIMRKSGISERDITAVMLTHVHPDHIGGLLTETGTAAFPNAHVFLSEPEHKALQDEKYRMHKPWRKVVEAYGDRIKTFRYGQKDLPGGLEAVEAPGHTPGHTVFRRINIFKLKIGSNGGEAKLHQEKHQDIWFIGDLLHAAELQFSDPDICAKFDADPARAVMSRKKILSLVEQGSVVVNEEDGGICPTILPSILCGAHLPFPGIGRITVSSDNKGFDYAGAVQ